MKTRKTSPTNRTPSSLSPRRLSPRIRAKTPTEFSNEDLEVANLSSECSKVSNQSPNRCRITPTNDSSSRDSIGGSFQVPIQPPRPCKRKNSDIPQSLFKNKLSKSSPLEIRTSKARRELFPSSLSGNLNQPVIDLQKQNRAILAENLKLKTKKWNYDFENDQPLTENEENINPLLDNSTSYIDSELGLNAVSATNNSSSLLNSLPLTGGSICGSDLKSESVASSSVRSSPISFLSQSERSEFDSNSGQFQKSKIRLKISGAWKSAETAPNFYRTRLRSKMLREVEEDIVKFDKEKLSEQAEKQLSNTCRQTFFGINQCLTPVLGAENITDHRIVATKADRSKKFAIFEDTRSEEELDGVKKGRTTPIKKTGKTSELDTKLTPSKQPSIKKFLTPRKSTRISKQTPKSAHNTNSIITKLKNVPSTEKTVKIKSVKKRIF